MVKLLMFWDIQLFILNLIEFDFLFWLDWLWLWVANCDIALSNRKPSVLTHFSPKGMTNSKIALYHTVRNFILFASMVVILDFEKNLGRYSSVKVPHIRMSVKSSFYRLASAIFHLLMHFCGIFQLCSLLVIVMKG